MKKDFFKKHKWVLTGSLIVTVFIGLVSFEAKDFKILKNLDIFHTLFKELNMYYVDEINPEDLVENAIEGMLDELDPYTSYISEADLDDFNFMRTGEYGGIGALIRNDGEYTVITDPYRGFPADKAGLKAGDVIVKIDGKSVKELSVSEVSDRLKGKPNTELQLVVRRPGEDKQLKKIVTREKISISGVPYYDMRTPEVGYIRVSNFTKDVSKDVKKAIQELKKQGAESLILDLRSNPGGLLYESIEISNLFLPKGQEIVSTKGKLKKYDEVYYTKNQPLDTAIPLAVLVNRSSASASEIVSGAMQDLDRGVVVGQRTFGKGLVQTTRPLSYNSQLKLTTAKYYIPSGRCIQALDYSHRNEDGSVGHIPDSLISEFETKNGRIVKDGGGINPDIVVKPESPGKITVSLYAKGLIFDYATQYVIEHKELGDVDDFTVTDEVYRDFIDFLKDKDYDYTTRSDEKLKELIKVAKSEKYFERAEEELTKLKDKLAHDKEKDLLTFQDEIKELLLEEIAGRYHYQEGRIKASLRDDEQLTKAIEILQSKKTYAGILKGQSGNILARK